MHVALRRSLIPAATSIVLALVAGCGQASPSPTPDASALVKAAIADETARHWDQAEAHLAQAIQADPRNKDAYFYLGFAQQEQGQAAAAERSYRTALIIDPDYQGCLFNLATLRATPAPYEAIELYYHIIQLNPSYAEAHLNLGFALKSVGQVAQGNEEIAKAIQLKPSLAAPPSSPTPSPTPKS